MKYYETNTWNRHTKVDHKKRPDFYIPVTRSYFRFFHWSVKKILMQETL